MIGEGENIFARKICFQTDAPCSLPLALCETHPLPSLWNDQAYADDLPGKRGE